MGRTFIATTVVAAFAATGTVWYAGIANRTSRRPRSSPRSLRLDGYESVDVDLAIDAGRTMTCRASLKQK